MRDLPPERARPTFILARGSYDAPTDRVEADTPAMLPKFEGPKNRLGLARWLVAPNNPLAARVVVNRYWGLLFGTGLVATPEDFGNQGRLPTHPALLDHLAVSLREGGWDLKAMLRQIVLSQTYRQSSVATARALELDPANEKLARGPSYRLASEQIRDSALAASSLLVARSADRAYTPTSPRALGGTGHAQCDDVCAGQGRRPASTQPVHGVEAQHAAAIRDQLRCRPNASSASSSGSGRARRCRRWCCSTTCSTSRPRACWPSDCCARAETRPRRESRPPIACCRAGRRGRRELAAVRALSRRNGRPTRVTYARRGAREVR